MEPADVIVTQHHAYLPSKVELQPSTVCSKLVHAVTKSSPVTGLGWPRGFQEVKVPRFRDNSTGWW